MGVMNMATHNLAMEKAGKKLEQIWILYNISGYVVSFRAVHFDSDSPFLESRAGWKRRMDTVGTPCHSCRCVRRTSSRWCTRTGAPSNSSRNLSCKTSTNEPLNYILYHFLVFTHRKMVSKALPRRPLYGKPFVSASSQITLKMQARPLMPNLEQNRHQFSLLLLYIAAIDTVCLRTCLGDPRPFQRWRRDPLPTFCPYRRAASCCSEGCTWRECPCRTWYLT